MTSRELLVRENRALAQIQRDLRQELHNVTWALAQHRTYVNLLEHMLAQITGTDVQELRSKYAQGLPPLSAERGATPAESAAAIPGSIASGTPAQLATE